MIGSVKFVRKVTRVVDLRGGVGNIYFVHSSTPRNRDNRCVEIHPEHVLCCRALSLFIVLNVNSK